MKKILLSAFALAAAAANAQNAVVSAKSGDGGKDEAVAVYYLPKTVLDVEVVAVNHQFKAGPYASDAKRLFGTAAEMQDRDNWEVKSVNIVRRAEPDQAQRYKVLAGFGTAGSLVSLTEKEILRGVNLPMGFGSSTCAAKPACEAACKGKGRKHREQDEENDGFKTNFKYKEGDSVAVKSDADFAFDLINGLRFTRAEMLQQNGDEVKDINAFLHKMEKEEADLNALFFGKTTDKVQKMTFSVSPDKEGNLEVTKFGSRGGFGDGGDAITLTVKKKVSPTKVNGTGGKNGYVYRVPAMAEVEVKQGKASLWKGTLPVAQLGAVESLPAGFFDKGDLKALFDTETGALLQISK